jgi:hypothetical protein
MRHIFLSRRGIDRTDPVLLGKLAGRLPFLPA